MISVTMSKHYYMMFCGGCRRVPMASKWRMNEYPYFVKLATRCRRPGRHPHAPVEKL